MGQFSVTKDDNLSDDNNDRVVQLQATHIRSLSYAVRLAEAFEVGIPFGIFSRHTRSPPSC